MLKGRLAFGDGSRVAPFPSAFVAWGADEELRARLTRAFANHWHVPAAPAEALRPTWPPTEGRRHRRGTVRARDEVSWRLHELAGKDPPSMENGGNISDAYQPSQPGPSRAALGRPFAAVGVSVLGRSLRAPFLPTTHSPQRRIAV